MAGRKGQWAARWSGRTAGSSKRAAGPGGLFARHSGRCRRESRHEGELAGGKVGRVDGEEQE